MKRRAFTAEEIAQLANNPYTYTVTAKHIRFTQAFKQRFWSEYCKGRSPRQIVRDCGYDAELLGDGRIEGLQRTIKKEALATDGFTRMPVPRQEETLDSMAGSQSPEKRIRELENKVKYLDQQMEFLKKITSIKTTEK